MVRRRRGSGEVIFDILSAVRDGGKKTHLMYRANVSYRTFKKKFEWLLRNGFISVQKGGDGDDVYVLTDKGLALLRDAQRFFMRLYEKPKPRL